MYEITYCSTASPDLDAAMIDDLLEDARTYNAAKDVSGCLLYHNREFIQLLEGEKEVVRGLYSKIAADTRHTHVVLLAEGSKEDRSFHDWSMAYYKPSPEDLQQLGRKAFVDNLVTFSILADKPTFPTLLFWSLVRQLLEKR